MDNDGVISGLLSKIAGRIEKLTEKTEKINGKKPELIVVILYCIGHILGSFVHEPCFDEAAAWLIARDSSLYNILFVAPHYEGHPSLWHLVLLPFAKLGAPYELSLGLVSLLFSGTATALFIYKAPFKRIIRLLMPFTYFFFYQYGVVSRPYCMIMLAFVLTSLAYGKREEHPGRLILSLWFLCLTSAYGIVLAGGITTAWLVEMFCRAYSKSQDKNSENGECRGTIRIFLEDYLFRKGKLFWLAFLLVYALFIIFRIIPAEDTFAILNAEQKTEMSFLLRLLYSCLGILSDLFITNTYSSGVTLSVSGLVFLEMLPSIIIGAVILIIVFKLAKQKKMLVLFFLPYILLAFSFSYLYMSKHHIGIMLLFMMFFFWVYIEKDASKEKIIADIRSVSSVKENNRKNKNAGAMQDLKKSLAILTVAFGMIIPLYWGISTTIIDIFVDYSCGREEYQYLKDNSLLDKSILAEWSEMPDTNRGEIVPVTFSGVITEILPYLEKDTFLNSPLKAGYDYSMIHKVPSGDVTEKLIESIKKELEPDIIIGMPDFSKIYSYGDFDFRDYECVFEVSGGIIWKGVPETSLKKIYVKNTK